MISVLRLLLFPTSTIESPNMINAGTRGCPLPTETTTTRKIKEPKSLIFFVLQTQESKREKQNCSECGEEEGGGVGKNLIMGANAMVKVIIKCLKIAWFQ